MPLPIAEELAAHLKHDAPHDPTDLIFKSPTGMPLRRKHFRRRVWLPAVKEAGFDDLTFHGLRHSAAGLMIEIGTHPRVIQKRLGHSSIRTTMDVYGRVLEDVDTEVVDGGLGVLLGGAPNSPRGLLAASGKKSKPLDQRRQVVDQGFSTGWR